MRGKYFYFCPVRLPLSCLLGVVSRIWDWPGTEIFLPSRLHYHQIYFYLKTITSSQFSGSGFLALKTEQPSTISTISIINLPRSLVIRFQMKNSLCAVNRVSDPHPACFLIADQEPAFWWPKFGKNITLYLSLVLFKGRPRHMRSLQPSKENIQHFRTWQFFSFSYFLG